MKPSEKSKSLLVAGAVVALDWSVKSLVIVSGWSYRVNTGGAFSLFAGEAWFFDLGVVVFLLLVSWVGRQKMGDAWLGWALVVGGALANLIDRFFRGGVVDFINLWRFPTFNLADVAIVLGFILLAVWPLVRPGEVK